MTEDLKNLLKRLIEDQWINEAMGIKARGLERLLFSEISSFPRLLLIPFSIEWTRHQCLAV